MPTDIERLIEEFVLRPDRLRVEDRQLVERLLVEDPAARALLDFFVGFHEELESLPDEVPDSVRTFADSLFGPPVPIVLRHLARMRASGPTVLAAQTTRSARARYGLLAVLGGRSDEPVVRLLRDRVDRIIRAYAIGLDRLPAVLSVPALKIAVAVDSDGRAVIPHSGAGVDWEEVSATLHPAVASWNCPSTGTSMVDRNLVEVQSVAGGARRVSIEGDARFAIVADGSKLHVLSLASGTGSLTLPTAESPITIWPCP